MNNHYIICACCWRKLVPPHKAEELAGRAQAEGREVRVVDDLCASLETGDEAVLSLLEGATVAACHERAVKNLLAWRGVEAKELIDLREGAGDVGPGDDAWFPVIDKDRCTECGQCHDFCPFGVYELVDDRVRVVHPTHCKNNCPACARNCPSGAIIFPKYGRSPINGGVEQEEKLRASGIQTVGANHSSLYAEAFRKRLIERRSMGTPLYKKNDDGTK